MNCNDKLKERLEFLKKEMLKGEATLRQYSIWLQVAEEEENLGKITKELKIVGPASSEECYARLEGLMQGIIGDEGIPGVDIIPGVGWENLVKVVRDIQDELKIDIGVCKYVKQNETGHIYCSSYQYPGMLIASLNSCLPPKRSQCSLRPKDYWKKYGIGA